MDWFRFAKWTVIVIDVCKSIYVPSRAYSYNMHAALPYDTFILFRFSCHHLVIQALGFYVDGG